jgi:hypothetical protein
LQNDLVFRVSGEDAFTSLQLEILNENSATDDDLIGTATVDLDSRDLPAAGVAEWISVDTGGSLQCMLSLRDAGSAAPTHWSLHVVVHGAEELQNVEYFGSQSPFVSVTLLPAKEDDPTTKRTRAHAEGDVTPVWGANERNHLVFSLGSDLVTSVLLEIFSEGTLDNELIGSCVVDLPRPYSSYMLESASDGWHSLDTGGRLHASLYYEVSKLKVVTTLIASAMSRGFGMRSKGRAASTKRRTLCVRVCRAEGLRQVQTFGAQDP